LPHTRVIESFPPGKFFKIEKKAGLLHPLRELLESLSYGYKRYL